MSSTEPLSRTEPCARCGGAADFDIASLWLCVDCYHIAGSTCAGIGRGPVTGSGSATAPGTGPGSATPGATAPGATAPGTAPGLGPGAAVLGDADQVC